ncbi:hypothetical protein SLA2020_155490 [Shorea laevis]
MPIEYHVSQILIGSETRIPSRSTSGASNSNHSIETPKTRVQTPPVGFHTTNETKEPEEKGNVENESKEKIKSSNKV